MRFLPAFQKPIYRGASVGLACALLCCLLNSLPWIRALENRALDNCFVIRGKRPSNARVMIVALDDATLENMQKPLMFISPELAQVVTYARTHGAEAIGVDLLLPDSDKGRLADILPGGIGDVQAMGIAVGRAGNVVLPLWIGSAAKPIMPIFEWDTDQFSGRWNRLGFVDLTIDADTYLRQQKLRVGGESGSREGKGTLPCFALAVFAEARGEGDDGASPAASLQLEGQPIPLNEDASLLVNYVGPTGSIPSVSFHEVLQAAATGRSLDVDFRGAIVLIGVTAATGQDLHATPFLTRSLANMLLSSWRGTQKQFMPGIEVHANIVATLADRAFITTPWLLSTPPLLVLFGLLLGVLYWRVKLETGMFMMLAHHVAWHVVCVLAFSYAHWRLEMIAMFLLGFLLYGTVFALRWRWIRRMMGMVKSEAIARSLEMGGSLELKGVEREISVFFCDIRDFSQFSENHQPGEVVQLLNSYFTAIVPIIEQHGGTINLYMGDGAMVLFNAPERQSDHALRAVKSALAVADRIHQLRANWTRLGASDFRIGIGVHTGTAILGTVGSPKRLDYTAIGDTVNTAARIESANKTLQTEILISQSTYNALAAKDLEQLGAEFESFHVLVKGKRERIAIHSVTMAQR